jgi:drug/metabolite transporter (DMT)-like permease
VELALMIARQVAFVGLLAGPIILVVFLGRRRGWNQTFVFVAVLGWALLFLGLNAMMAGDANALPSCWKE